MFLLFAQKALELLQQWARLRTVNDLESSDKTAHFKGTPIILGA